MKNLFYISILLLPLLVCSQNNETKTDSLSSLNPFIQDYSNQLNIKLDVTNEQINYFMPYKGNKADYKGDLPSAANRYLVLESSQQKQPSIPKKLTAGYSEVEKPPIFPREIFLNANSYPLATVILANKRASIMSRMVVSAGFIDS